MKIALENIETNNLGGFVNLVKSNPDKLFSLEHDQGQNYFFSMCNPPFYDTEESVRDREEYKVQCDIFRRYILQLNNFLKVLTSSVVRFL